MACIGVLSRMCALAHYLAQYRGSYLEVVVKMTVPKVNKNFLKNNGEGVHCLTNLQAEDLRLY